MFWGHDGELFATSVIHKYFAKICKRYGGCENTFLELENALQGSITCNRMSTSDLNGIKCCKYCVNSLKQYRAHPLSELVCETKKR